MDDAELHANLTHPGYEYATTSGPRKAWYGEGDPPEGDGWERNTDRGDFGWERFDFHEESYWRRRLTGQPVCGARTVFWPDDEACDAECILPRGHRGTDHEDAILGWWSEDDLPTTVREPCGCWTDDLRTRWCPRLPDGSEPVLHTPATGTQPRACQSSKAGIWATRT